MDEFKRQQDPGIGGWHCPCCDGPKGTSPKRKKRKLIRRMFHQQARARLREKLRQELRDGTE